MLVVIPTAGIGSRLDLFTRYFNKSMIQLGDTPVISKIIDSYPSNTKFIIATGYKGDHIIEYLNLVYPQKNIKIVRIKKFQGPGSSLTLTLKKCLGYINKPFIFHANDSIFTDKKFYKNLKNDTMFISRKDCNTMKYATVEIKNNFKKVNNKLTYLRKDFYNYTGVSYVADFKKFKKIIEESTSNEGELEYFKSLDAKKIKFIFIKNWFDIGSKTTKETAEKYFIKKSILPKYDQGIFFKNQMVYKFFVNSKITKSRAVRSKLLYPYVPKIIKRKKYFYILKNSNTFKLFFL